VTSRETGPWRHPLSEGAFAACPISDQVVLKAAVDVPEMIAARSVESRAISRLLVPKIADSREERIRFFADFLALSRG
jgi:hypothetical protein